MILAILPDHKRIYDLYLNAARTLPAYSILEHDQRQAFDKKQWLHLARHGLFDLLSKKKDSVLKTCLAFEALGAACENNGLIFAAAAHLTAGVYPLVLAGSADQQKEYLGKALSGKSIMANAITEAGAGSDVFSMSSAAIKRSGKYILNGEKKYVTNAPLADCIVVYALTDAKKGFFGGVSAFLVDPKAGGVKVSKAKEKMGLRTAQMGDISMKNTELAAGRLLGKEGAGAQIFNQAMLCERVVMSAFLCGQLSRVLDKTVIFMKQRTIGGKNLMSMQAVQHTLAGIKTKLSAGKNLVYDAAFAIDERSKDAMAKASMTKLFVSENTVDGIRQLQELYGAHGYMCESGIEREYRDAYASLIYSGTSAIQKNIIAGSL